MSPNSYIYERLLRVFEGSLKDISKAEMARKKKAGEFEYIPFAMESFIEQMKAARDLLEPQVSDRSFIDVGCGIGTKVIVARDFFRHCYGVEITPSYVKVALKLLASANKHIHGDTKGTIYKQDAFKHSLAPYDVIYFYCPLALSELEQRLEEHIVNTAKVGALLIGNLKRHQTLWAGKDKRVKRVWRDTIYQKVSHE